MKQKNNNINNKAAKRVSVKGIRHKHERAASSSALMCWWNKRLVKRKWRFSPLSPPLSPLTHTHRRPPSNALAHIHFLKGEVWGPCFPLIWRTPQLQIIADRAASRTVECTCRCFDFSHRKNTQLSRQSATQWAPALAQYWKRTIFFRLHLSFLKHKCFFDGF